MARLRFGSTAGDLGSTDTEDTSTSGGSSDGNVYDRWQTMSRDQLNESESGMAGGGATAVDLVSPDPNESSDQDAVVVQGSNTNDGMENVAISSSTPTTSGTEIKNAIQNAREFFRPGEGQVDNAPAHDSTPTDGPVETATNAVENALDGNGGGTGDGMIGTLLGGGALVVAALVGLVALSGGGGS